MAANLARAATQLVRPEALAWITVRHGRHTTRLARAAARLLQATTIERDIPASPVLSVDDIRAIRCPVLAIYGGRSDLAEQAALMEATLPRCTTVVLPGQEHSVLIEVTTTVRDLILQWLDRCHAVESGGR
jgi:pimeloyl-ACP methyl ester carboxylesterase